MSCSDQRNFRTLPLLASRSLGEGIILLEFPWSDGKPKPGQFFMLRPKRSSVLLGRPISVFAWNQGKLSFLVALRGTGTIELAELREGEEAELSGPLGNAWPEAEDRDGKASEASIRKLPPALIGGGIGIAPLVFLASMLPDNSYDFYAGFKSTPYGLTQLKSRTTILATEDGCEGDQGRIPDFLDPSKYSAVYACGPEAMLKAVAASCKATETPCFLSLERRMACGVGACLGCTVRTRAGNRRCCADGPVFDAREVLFDE